MRIMVMTGKFGMGHYVAAEAIKQQLDISNIDAEVEIIDWFQYLSPKHADQFYNFYTVIVNKGSRLYNKRYVFLENRKTNQKPELSHYFLSHFARFMVEKKPDMIITTLPLCSQLASMYQDKYDIDFPLIACVTDIAGHSEWISKNTDLYLVGSQSVKDKFIAKGVAPKSIYITGIPVRVEFDNTAAEVGKNSSTPRKVLLMGGGLGILPEDDEFYAELNRLSELEVTIITGKNSKLYQRIRGKYSNLKILGYVNNVCDYMKASDVVITKPGGITIFESIYTGRPILALNPFLQQEINNAKFIQEMQIGAVVSGSSIQCVQEILRRMKDENFDEYRKHILSFKNQLKSNSVSGIISNVMNDFYILDRGSKLSDYPFERIGSETVHINS